MNVIAWENGVTKLNKATMEAFEDNIRRAIEGLYPIGSVYMNLSDGTNPATLLGFGRWTRVKDRFVYALGDSGGVGDLGGSASVKLSASQIPSLSGSTVSGGEHFHEGVSLDGNAFSANTGASGDGFGVGIENGKRYGLLKVSSTGSAHSHDVRFSNGDQSSVSVMPPYVRAYVWKRVG